MSEVLDRLAERTRLLREDFERAFQLPLPEPERGLQPFLRVHVAGERMAIALDEVLGLELDPTVVRVPGCPPPLLGLATLRGSLWPTYDLARLLGRSESAPCLVVGLARGTPSVAFAFERLESLVRVNAESILQGAPPGAAGDPLIGAIRDGETVVPLISLARLIDAGLGSPVWQAQERGE